MTKKADPLAEALDKATATPNAGQGGRVMQLYSDRPDVLESIRRARRDRKLSHAHIAKVLSSNGDGTVSRAAVQNWLSKEGIE